jgi:hypothetical protein
MPGRRDLEARQDESDFDMPTLEDVMRSAQSRRQRRAAERATHDLADLVSGGRRGRMRRKWKRGTAGAESDTNFMLPEIAVDLDEQQEEPMMMDPIRSRCSSTTQQDRARRSETSLEADGDRPRSP